MKLNRLVIIGGGAAGIFAAIHAKANHPHLSVIVLERTNQLLSKVRISGGGRCNVTHACFDPKKLISFYPRGSKELLGPFHRFGPQEVVQWFAKKDVQLKTENDGRMFPTTDSSQTIIDCLLKEAERLKVDIRLQQKVEENDLAAFKDDRILLATGSASIGHKIAKHFGHTIVDPVPSLFTFNVPTSSLLPLSGISVPEVKLKVGRFTETGPLLLTHWGFSGPAAIKLSAWAARELHALHYNAPLFVDWAPQYTVEQKFNLLLNQTFPLPKQLFKTLAERTGKSHASLRQLAEKLSNDRYLIEGKTTYKEEFVTAGGISLKDVNFRTMESKIKPGLYFAGEILDIDGVTGGFNFQNAWTTAWIMAQMEQHAQGN